MCVCIRERKRGWGRGKGGRRRARASERETRTNSLPLETTQNVPLLGCSRILLTPLVKPLVPHTFPCGIWQPVGST